MVIYFNVLGAFIINYHKLYNIICYYIKIHEVMLIDEKNSIEYFI